jgi:hypothetical protein
MCMFCGSLFVLLYFFFWAMCCLFFFDILILITPLVSSNVEQLESHLVFIVIFQRLLDRGRGTISTHSHTHCMLRNTTTIHNKYVVDQNVQHFKSVRFRLQNQSVVLFFSFFFFRKTRHVVAKQDNTIGVIN